MTATNDSGQGPLPPLSGESKAQTIKVPVPKGMEKHGEILRKLYEKAKKAEKAGKE